MKDKRLLRIFERLSAYCAEHKVLSEGELALKIRECLDSLSAAEREELERNLKGNLEDLIFKSITTSTEKISVFSPDLHTRINYQGEFFYCMPTHGYMAEKLEAAFLRWTKLRSPLSALKAVVTDFMDSCNYELKEERISSENEYYELIAVKKDRTRYGSSIHLFIFPSIKFVTHFMDEHPEIVAQSESGEEHVIIVPTEKTPAPFISFFREHEVGGGTMIWVVDAAKKTVNPFMGTPRDAEIEENFAAPEQARSAVSVWMRKMRFVD